MTTKDNPCTSIPRLQPDVTITKEIAEAIGRDFRTLPVFEKGLFEHTYIQHYSLLRNKYLRCHWEKYKRDFEERVFAPFQFLDIRDYHFFNCKNRLYPPASFHTKTEFRRTLKPGPGVDRLGQMPIPQELHMKRGEQKKADRRKVSLKGKEKKTELKDDDKKRAENTKK